MSTPPLQLPPPPIRTRVRNILRAVKRRLRTITTAPLPHWKATEAAAVVTGDDSRTRITAGSSQQLHTVTGGEAVTSDLTIRIAHWEAPWPGWSGRLGPLPGVIRLHADLPATGRGEVVVHIGLTAPLPVRRITAAVLPLLEPGHAAHAQVSPDLSVTGEPPPWLRADAPTGAPSPVAASAIAHHDVELAHTRYGLRTAGGADTVLADAANANPRGRQDYGHDLETGVLRWHDGAAPGWQIARDKVEVVAGRTGDPLDARQIAALGRLRSVSVEESDISPVAQAATLAQLAMTGLVLHTPALPAAVDSLLAKELTTVLRATPPDHRADLLDWEIRSAAQRREAMRHHAPEFALPWSRPPTVTALLVTKRPGHLTAAVASLARQTYPELDIVVGTHGFNLPADERDRLTAHGPPTTVLAVPEGLNLGQALGMVSRAARGTLLTKVDDDDRYGRQHLWDLVLARHYSGASVVGKGAEFVYLEQYDSTVRRRMGRELYTDVVAGGTMLLSRNDLEEVGGWRPVPRSVDRGLLDRVLRAGGLIYRTHGLGFVYTRHSQGHTWDTGLDYFTRDPLRSWRGLPPYEEFGHR